MHQGLILSVLHTYTNTHTPQQQQQRNGANNNDDETLTVIYTLAF